MSEIQDEAYSEAMDEIERLKLELHNEKQYAADLITTFRCEAEDMKALLARAADALEEEFGPGNTDLMTKDPWNLIKELREATQ